MAAVTQDPRNLHDLAVDVHTDLQKLATGLAHAGAAPPAIAQLTKMAEVVGQIVKVLGQGPVGGEDQAGPAHPLPGQAPEAAPQSPAPQAAQPSAPSPQQPQRGDQLLNASTHALHAAMIASKAARQPSPS